MTRLILAACVVMASLFSVGVPALGAGAPPQFIPPKAYYLALGDSITFGFQTHKALLGLPPSDFNTGYVDVFAERLTSIRPSIEVINYGCPGETTTTFIEGPCAWKLAGRSLHDPFEGSQLDAAVAFLRTHKGQVSPITVHLFGNDVNEFVASCGGDLACIQREAPAAIAGFGARLQFILHQLRTASPDAEILVISGWNSQIDPDLIDVSDPLIQALNAAIADITGRERGRYVDMASVFNPPDIEARIATLCSLTLICSHGDSHPSDLGYEAIAQAVLESSGYQRFQGLSDEAIAESLGIPPTPSNP